MSIIYDALKKVENTKNAETSSAQNTANHITKPNNKLKYILLYILVICLGLFLSNIVFNYMQKNNNAQTQNKNLSVELKRITPPTFKDIPADTSIQKEENIAKTAEIQKPAAPKFVLNGVFFEGDNGYALINNIIVRVGDEIGKAKVKTITLNEVQLDLEGEIVKLSNKPS